jgi:hypothetical protein
MSNLDANEGADQKLWRLGDQDDGMEASFLISPSIFVPAKQFPNLGVWCVVGTLAMIFRSSTSGAKARTLGSSPSGKSIKESAITRTQIMAKET